MKKKRKKKKVWSTAVDLTMFDLRSALLEHYVVHKTLQKMQNVSTTVQDVRLVNVYIERQLKSSEVESKKCTKTLEWNSLKNKINKNKV